MSGSDLCVLFFAGIMYSMVALGPAVGFLTGGILLSLYVDLPASPPDTLEERSER